jgi:nucleoside 2-deoxyribosyltransferase
MRRDFRADTRGHEAEIVEGDLADIDSCDAVLAAFTAPDEGTAMEAWYAHSRGIVVLGLFKPRHARAPVDGVRLALGAPHARRAQPA